MRLGRLEISGGALTVLALLYYLDDNGVFLWVLLGGFFHELGHWGAVRALGGRVARLRLSCAGAELRVSSIRPLSPGRMLLAALAGPGVNLVTAWISVWLAHRNGRLYFFTGLNLGLALFNLLPADWLDGGKALAALFVCMEREELGQRLVRLCSDAVTGLLLAAGLALLWQSGGRNFTLLVAGLWMAAVARREEKEGVL